MGTVPPAAARRPTRGALLLRSAWLVALGALFGRALVLNPHDNAYLAPATAGQLLPLLAVPFVVAALLPEGSARRIAAWIAVVLVWGVGGLIGAVFLFYAGLIVVSSLVAGKLPLGGVAVVHVVGTALLVPTVLGISYRLFRVRAW